MYKLKRIGLDVDNVLADYVSKLKELNPQMGPQNFYQYQYSVKNNRVSVEEIRNLEPMFDPRKLRFEPCCYVSARKFDVSITEQWVANNGFPQAPVYHVADPNDKIHILREQKVDLFVEDSYENWLMLNRNGITTLLLTQPWNIQFDAGYLRINSLSEVMHI